VVNDDRARTGTAPEALETIADPSNALGERFEIPENAQLVLVRRFKPLLLNPG
jgi:hypothetical protein